MEQSAQFFFSPENRVAPLGIVAMEGAQELADKIEAHLVRWANQAGMNIDTFRIGCSCPRFSSGDGKGILESSVRGYDLYFVVDVGNYSCTYKYFGQENHMSPDDHYQDLKRLIQAAMGKAHRITVVMPYPKREVEIVPQNIPLDIPYEDDDLLIVDKPAGMVVHPGHGNWDGTLVNALTYHLRTLPMFREGDLRAGLVHRIDKDTSGLLVVAKNERAHARLAKQFFDHTIVRRYYALVWGNPDADEGTIEGNIGRSPKDKLQMCVFADGEQGKHAVTHWRVVRRYGYVTLVECRLETGRTHQIRVHMAWKGFPLFNDARYGGARILKGTTFSKYRQFVENCFALLPRQALHARCLGFVHPSTGREVYFESELPADFRAVLDRWENYAAHVRTDAE